MSPTHQKVSPKIEGMMIGIFQTLTSSILCQIKRARILSRECMEFQTKF